MVVRGHAQGSAQERNPPVPQRIGNRPRILLPRILLCPRIPLRLILFPALLLGVGLANGCYFTETVYYTGHCSEYPESVAFPDGPVLEAYASHDGRRFCIKYRAWVIYERSHRQHHEDLWLSITRERVDQAVKKGTACKTIWNSLRLPELASDAGNDPRWSVALMDKLEICRLQDVHKARRGRFLGVYYSPCDPATQEELTAEKAKELGCLRRYIYVMAKTGSNEADILEFCLPTTEHRTTSGYLVQVFQPFAAILDVITFPWQYYAYKGI